MEVNILDEREDGTRAYVLELTKDEYEELVKLTDYRGMMDVEKTIKTALLIEIEAMY